MTSFQRPRIAIVGAGPAGLTLAAILKRHSWTCAIFDADAAVDSRDQGGMLDLHKENGQLALAKAGLLEEFMAIARHDDQEGRLLDHKTAAVLREEIPEPGKGDRPEIDRIELRRLLLRAADSDAIRWSARVREVLDHPDGGYAIRLDAGIEGPFDLVVGADGAWSRVRRAVTPVMPVYTGVTFVEYWLSNVDHYHPTLAKLVGHGTMFALGESKGIIAQRNGGGTVRVYAAYHRELTDMERKGGTTAIELGEVLSQFEGWAQPLRSLITDADRCAAVRPIVSLPSQLDWGTKPGLTLVGDAAHVMPPLGLGVNLAMLDAAELAEALITSEDWREAVSRQEATTFARARKASHEAQKGFTEMFSAS